MQNNIHNKLSIATFEKNPIKRGFFKFLERLIGVTTVDQIYCESKIQDKDENWWSSALRVLNIDVDIKYLNNVEVPEKESLIVVCNHPYGITDGILLGKILSFYRDDYMFLANEALQKIPEICERIIPLELNTLDKKEKSNNISAIRRAHSHLTDGGALVIFPGGEVSSSSGIFNTPVDSKWSSLPVKLSKSFQCPILPVYIHGRSSYLFQLVTKISFSLRKYFLFREVLKNRNKTINVTINDLHNLNDYNSKFDDVDLSNEIYETMKRDSKYLS